MFKGKLTRCRTAKANLTKAQTAFQKNVEDYVEAETQPIVTKKRKANAVMEGAQKMESRLENLRQTMEDFIVYVSGLGEDAFESPTTPTTVMLGANSDLDDREKAMREKLTEHEQVIMLVMQKPVILLRFSVTTLRMGMGDLLGYPSR